jgi:hypothetical protein
MLPVSSKYHDSFIFFLVAIQSIFIYYMYRFDMISFIVYPYNQSFEVIIEIYVLRQ